MYAMILRSRV